MGILITNDDGILAEGIYTLAKKIHAIKEVIVAAPNREQSAKGHSITLHRPLRVKPVKFFDTPIEAYEIDGTPADCVKLAVDVILKDRRPDLVISGINNGPNLGTDVIYSGTVSAAVEAAVLGIPSIAVSMASSKIDTFQDAADFICKFHTRILQIKESRIGIFNVNFPTCRKESIKGVKITTLGIRRYDNVFTEGKDPRGNSYYWISGTPLDLEQQETSDILAIQDKYISITPIHFDLTDYKAHEGLKNWNIEL